MISLFTLIDDCDTITAASGISEQLGEQEANDLEDDFEKKWDVSGLSQSIERGPSAIQRVISLWGSLSLPVPATIIEARHWIDDDTRTIASYSRVEASVKTKDGDVAPAQKLCKQKTTAYEKELAELQWEMNGKSPNLPIIEEPSSTVKTFETKLTTSQTEAGE